ncbi:DMT family transporter [Thiofilum flexile]|uniref:DMT family transporter n=1 Tax=Thiofilum flexile TaxID=125627 RepID=UPI00037755E0|nr:DMT family transporter [Thiofilum flexile]
MSFLIFLALFNGVLIALSRTINGQLGHYVGSLQASFWNHAVGFLFLCCIVAVVYGFALGQFEFQQVPFYAWLGGLWGALFVFSSSYVFPRLGAVNASMLIISGQIVSSVLFDIIQGGSVNVVRILGIALIAGGVILAAWNRAR